ncbi:hypothetical protein F511_36713 [Dorcoceras hygrometricum]|uniref:Uncharacterized protein n=1 Tax=Dorcoceras hygrometricum TaxID=472368 RepID=A0A2Z7CDB9_9LAMI|nr:hypothetical protein F511_36713 [Dorcoceras hygrometricum]
MLLGRCPHYATDFARLSRISHAHVVVEIGRLSHISSVHVAANVVRSSHISRTHVAADVAWSSRTSHADVAMDAVQPSCTPLAMSTPDLLALAVHRATTRVCTSCMGLRKGCSTRAARVQRCRGDDVAVVLPPKVLPGPDPGSPTGVWPILAFGLFGYFLNLEL